MPKKQQKEAECIYIHTEETEDNITFFAMVVFTCNACGDSIRKPKVEQHLRECRACRTLSCMDCSKDFDRSSYAQHNTYDRRCVLYVEAENGLTCSCLHASLCLLFPSPLFLPHWLLPIILAPLSLYLFHLLSLSLSLSLSPYHFLLPLFILSL